MFGVIKNLINLLKIDNFIKTTMRYVYQIIDKFIKTLTNLSKLRCGMFVGRRGSEAGFVGNGLEYQKQ